MFTCQDDLELQQLLNEQLDAADESRIVLHVESCERCQERLDVLCRREEDLTWLSHAPSESGSWSFWPAHLVRAVQAAYEARIIHRDLKPANVLFTDAGVPTFLLGGQTELEFSQQEILNRSDPEALSRGLKRDRGPGGCSVWARTSASPHTSCGHGSPARIGYLAHVA
jgi:serine/threonine protein kinase